MFLKSPALFLLATLAILLGIAYSEASDPTSYKEGQDDRPGVWIGRRGLGPAAYFARRYPSLADNDISAGQDDEDTENSYLVPRAARAPAVKAKPASKPPAKAAPAKALPKLAASPKAPAKESPAKAPAKTPSKATPKVSSEKGQKTAENSSKATQTNKKTTQKATKTTASTTSATPTHPAAQLPFLKRAACNKETCGKGQKSCAATTGKTSKTSKTGKNTKSAPKRSENDNTRGFSRLSKRAFIDVSTDSQVDALIGAENNLDLSDFQGEQGDNIGRGFKAVAASGVTSVTIGELTGCLAVLGISSRGIMGIHAVENDYLQSNNDFSAEGFRAQAPRVAAIIQENIRNLDGGQLHILFPNVGGRRLYDGFSIPKDGIRKAIQDNPELNLDLDNDEDIVTAQNLVPEDEIHEVARAQFIETTLRNVAGNVPVTIHSYDVDNPDQLTTFIAQLDQATHKGQIFINGKPIGDPISFQ